MSKPVMSHLDADQVIKSIFIPWDYMALDSSGSTQDIYTFYQDGLSGTLVLTITINYTDSTKNTILNVDRSQ